MHDLMIAVCDNNATDEQGIIKMITTSPYLTRTATYDDSQLLIDDLVPGYFDLVICNVFLKEDIEALDNNQTVTPHGIKTIERVQAIDPYVPVALTTKYEDYAREAFRLNAKGYLEKPIQKERLYALLQQAVDHKMHLPGINIYTQKKLVHLPLNKIVYAEQQQHKVHLHLSNGATIATRAKLCDIQAEFEQICATAEMQLAPFVRTHQSYLANCAYIKDIDQNLMAAKMLCGEQVYVGHTRFAQVVQTWQEWLESLAQKKSL